MFDVSVIHPPLALSAGVLLGIAIRTGSPLSLNLAEPVWKQLAGMNLTIADLSEVRTQPPPPQGVLILTLSTDNNWLYNKKTI